MQILAPASIFKHSCTCIGGNGTNVTTTTGTFCYHHKKFKKFWQFEFNECISLSLYTHKYIYNYQKYVVCAQLPGNDTCRWQRDNMSSCHQNQIPYFVVEIKYWFVYFLGFGGSNVYWSYSCVTPIIKKLDKLLILEEQ